MSLSKWMLKKGKEGFKAGVNAAKKGAKKAGEVVEEGASGLLKKAKDSEAMNKASKVVTGNAVAAKKGAEKLIKENPKKAVAASGAAGAVIASSMSDDDEDKKKKKKRPYLDDEE